MQYIFQLKIAFLSSSTNCIQNSNRLPPTIVVDSWLNLALAQTLELAKVKVHVSIATAHGTGSLRAPTLAHRWWTTFDGHRLQDHKEAKNESEAEDGKLSHGDDFLVKFGEWLEFKYL